MLDVRMTKCDGRKSLIFLKNNYQTLMLVILARAKIVPIALFLAI
jgi:hypothetical protein